MKSTLGRGAVLPPEQIATRKRYIAATLVTCIVVTMVAATIHVVELGSNRMEEMRSKASYDLKDMHTKIRAAGEDITRSRLEIKSAAAVVKYTPAEVEAMLTAEQWRELDSLVAVPEGVFLMGSDRARDDVYNRPQHKIAVKTFMIDKYPVTNVQYARFVAAGHRPPLHWKNGRIPLGTEMHPVTMVSWYDAMSYAKWAGKRLPTEAEWEKAARGTDGRRWPWGDKMDPTRLNTYYSVGSTTPVTAYPAGASPYGAFDMAGNVSQWTADDFKPYPGTEAPAEVFMAKIPQANSTVDRAMKVVDLVVTDKPYKTLRGGSWKSDPFSTSTYHRNFSWPHYASDFLGFVVLKMLMLRVSDAAAARMRRVVMLKRSGLLGGGLGLLMLAFSDAALALDSYRYLHVTIDTPWFIFLFLLPLVLSPLIIMAGLYWYFTVQKSKQKNKSDMEKLSGT